MEQKGVTVWFTGMSGAGKTALANSVEAVRKTCAEVDEMSRQGAGV